MSSKSYNFEGWDFLVDETYKSVYFNESGVDSIRYEIDEEGDFCIEFDDGSNYNYLPISIVKKAIELWDGIESKELA